MNPKERIIKLLEEGKITPEQAIKLLEALKESHPELKETAKKTAFKMKKLMQGILKGIWAISKEITENPLETEFLVNFTPEIEKTLKIRQYGGDLSIKFSESTDVRIKGIGYYRVDDNVIDLVSEKSESIVPQIIPVEIEIAGGDLEILGQARKSIKVQFVGGDLRILLERFSVIEAEGEGGDVFVEFLPEFLKEVEIELEIKNGEVKFPFEFEKHNGIYRFKPEGAPSALFRLKLVYGDAVFKERGN